MGEGAIDVQVEDDYTPPVPVHTEVTTSTCPTCDRPFKKHSSLELLRCSQAEPVAPVESCPLCGGRGGHHEGCAADEAASEYETWKARRDEDETVAQAAAAWRDERAREGKRVPRASAPSASPPVPAVAFVTVTDHPAIVPAVTTEDVLNGAAGLPQSMGIVDYEALAAGMRTVLERERDEIIRRGGPIEKQNIELKERLAALLDEVATWRKRHQGAVEQRNTFEAQLTEAQKAIRQLKRDTKGLREKGDRAKAVETKQILAEVQNTPGFTVRRKGNGHFGIYKDDVWVTDMASSPGQQRANMNTRVQLRKAGVNV